MMIELLLFITSFVVILGVFLFFLFYLRLTEIRDSILDGTKDIENEIFQIRIQLLNKIKDHNN
jgi:hypothetical protein